MITPDVMKPVTRIVVPLQRAAGLTGEKPERNVDGLLTTPSQRNSEVTSSEVVFSLCRA